jgi:hypothetical protein
MCASRLLAALTGLIVASMLAVSGLPGADCNKNGVEDSTDIRAGTSLDCNPQHYPHFHT